MKKQLRDDPHFRKWAEHAVKNLDRSDVMIGIFGRATRDARLEFALQIGHCLLEGKPIVLLVPNDVRLPDKVMLVIDVVEHYDDALGPEACYEAAKRAMERVGKPLASG